MANVVVLGAGMMGTALCTPLLDRGHRVRLVGTHLDGEIVRALQATGVHPGLGCPLPPGASFCAVEQLGEAMEGADVVALGVSSAGVRWAGRTLTPFLRPGLPLLMVSKGLELDGSAFKLLPDALLEELPAPLAATLHPVAIAGPCIAGELARRAESCVIFTGRDRDALDRLAGMACTDYYHVRVSLDLAGSEVCAALKNAYAMGVGFGGGLNLRRGGTAGASVALHNYEAAVFAQALQEMARLVELAGGQRAAAFGLAGAGDLMVTCQGGRTGRFGGWLGRGLELREAIAQMAGATLECLDVIRVVGGALPALEQAGKLRPDELPLLRHLHEVAEGRSGVAVPFARFGFGA